MHKIHAQALANVYYLCEKDRVSFREVERIARLPEGELSKPHDENYVLSPAAIYRIANFFWVSIDDMYHTDMRYQDSIPENVIDIRREIRRHSAR